MKIIYKNGDVSKAEEDIIAHGCNAQGKMASGVAKAIRTKFPKAYEYYYNAYIENNHSLTVGKIVWAPCGNKAIANCITQEFYGRDGRVYVDYNAIRQCMKVLNNEGHLSNLTVAMPMIGSALGGGDWKIIEKIIEEEFTDTTPVVYIFK